MNINNTSGCGRKIQEICLDCWSTVLYLGSFISIRCQPHRYQFSGKANAPFIHSFPITCTCTSLSLTTVLPSRQPDSTRLPYPATFSDLYEGTWHNIKAQTSTIKYNKIKYQKRFPSTVTSTPHQHYCHYCYIYSSSVPHGSPLNPVVRAEHQTRNCKLGRGGGGYPGTKVRRYLPQTPQTPKIQNTTTKTIHRARDYTSTDELQPSIRLTPHSK